MRSKLFIAAISFWLLAFGAQAAQIKLIEANGAKAWLIEDHILPIVSIEMAFKNSGSAHDPAGKDGLGYAVASMVDEGADKYTSQEYQKLLEENAVSFSPDLDKDNFYVSLKTLTENLDLAADLTNIAITKPNFTDPDFERVKEQIMVGLKKRR